ncbi:neuroendocrine convertase 1 [Plutella xylostella]|uniref:neuroendocrine convertase 1 n=1 Tax=Plutella xylostella TaxID=51655 RepID=UPI00203272A7|nr:neuroendocrine convertase 1 [Plutella xylostella]
MIKVLLLTTILSVASCQFNLDADDAWSSVMEVPGAQRSKGHSGEEHTSGFVNEWTVEVVGGAEVAQLVALELGYVFGGEVLGFPGTYIFYKYGHSKQRRTPSDHHTASLNNDRRVRWAEQSFSKTRVKRYPIDGPEKILHRVKRVENESKAVDEPVKERQKRAVRADLFNDELWTDEWYLHDTRTRSDLPRLDLNVLPVYNMGFNGKGVRVTVLDDGIEHNHTDLKTNYDPEISWDCNDRDSDPSPRYDEQNLNSHGTRCAGEIAMVANNRKCGVGVAWGARIGGIRLLDGQITDRIEGEAIGFAFDKVDIYSASWGPDDNGETVEGPGRLAAEAFRRGVTQGRGGKGSIYIWANGNGGKNHDNCNCDGYASSIYTISIASASQHGLFPWYGEICSSTLATTYSSGAYKEQKIATTDIRNSCTLRHTGTSAAAPLAAGIIALVLSANPNLTWRDVQHLIVWKSEYAPVSNNPGWKRNGAGLRFDVRFGFGLLNAEALVKAALDWQNVPQKYICKVDPIMLNENDNLIETGKTQDVYFEVLNDCLVNYVEHVQLVVSLAYSRRGALQIGLTSPRGTKIPVLTARPKDSSTNGFSAWPFNSVATWGENPKGAWVASFTDESDEENSGKLESIKLIIHGTYQMPHHMRNGPRRYDNNYSYQQIFNYFKQYATNLNTENDENAMPTANTNYKQMQDELLRVHHRNY